jgi:peroxiredoxin
MMNSKTRSILAFVGGLCMIGFAAPLASAQESAGKPEHTQPHKDKEHKDKAGKDEHKSASQESIAKIGEAAPAFELKDTDGKTWKLADLKGKIVVLEWFNPECPYVKKHHGAVGQTMSQTAAKYKDKNVVWLAVNSGAPGKQGAGLEANAAAKKSMNIGYPILLDETGKTGLAYGSKNTPTMYVIDEKGILVYRGAIDDNPSPTKLGETNYVDQALRQVTAHESVSTPETRAYGCSIKYPGRS